MPNEFSHYFNGLLAALRTEESEQKKRYDSAIDMEDFSEATTVIIDARTKIQHLRKWIQEIQRISNEIETVFAPVSTAVELNNLKIIDEIDLEEPIAAGNEVLDAAQCFSVFLFGKPYAASGWKELLETLCELMIIKKPYRFASLCGNVYTNLAEKPILCLNEQENEPYRRLSNGLYIFMGGSDDDIKMRCQYILSACEYSNDELQIL